MTDRNDSRFFRVILRRSAGYAVSWKEELEAYLRIGKSREVNRFINIIFEVIGDIFNLSSGNCQEFRVYKANAGII